MKCNFDQNFFIFMIIIYINNEFAKDSSHHQPDYSSDNSSNIQPSNMETSIPETPNIPDPLHNNLHNPTPVAIPRLITDNRILSNNKLNIPCNIRYLLYIT